MNFNKKTGYTLAEVMIVLLVLTIIFAAFAPIITKRKPVTSQNVWNWVQDDGNGIFYNHHNAYTDSERLFIGIKPYLYQIDDLKDCNDDNFLDEKCVFYPDSRIVIRSMGNVGNNDVQRQIQFRFGGSKKCSNGDVNSGICSSTSDYTKNEFAGSWLMDGKNILLGGKYQNLKYTEDQSKRPSHNIALGFMALNNLEANNKPARNNIAIGSHAGFSVGKMDGGNSAHDNVFIGYRAGFNDTSGSNNVFVGVDAGFNNKTGDNNVYIGYKAGYMANSNAHNNVYIGHKAGYSLKGYGNIAIGRSALASDGQEVNISGNYNVAIGDLALSRFGANNYNSDYSYNTAIGTGACAYLYAGSKKTCIGTFAAYDIYNRRSFDAYNDMQITYIGNYPKWTGSNTKSENASNWKDNYIAEYMNNYRSQHPGATPEELTQAHNTAVAEAQNAVVTQVSSGNIGSSAEMNNTYYGCGDDSNEYGDTPYHHNFNTSRNDYGEWINDVNNHHINTRQCYYRNSRRARYLYTMANSLIEIYNPETENGYLQYPYGTDKYGDPSGRGGMKSNATTMINANLIVRGRMFNTVGPNLYAWMKLPVDVNRMQYTGYSGHYNVPSYRDGDIMGEKTHVNYTQGFTTSPVQYFPYLSDRRLKNITSKSTSGLDKISKLKVYNFNFKNDNNKEPHVGVIAQELEKIFPNSVFEDEDGYLQIKWDEMFYAAINAIKELDRKIIALVKRAAKVEEKITKLEKQNKDLKLQVTQLSARVEKLKNK